MDTSTNKKKQKAAWISGCVITILTIIFVILSIYDFSWAAVIAYIFVSAQMLSVAAIITVLIIVIILLFQDNRQVVIRIERLPGATQSMFVISPVNLHQTDINRPPPCFEPAR